MAREAYVTSLISRLVNSVHDQIRDTLSLNVESDARRFEQHLTDVLKHNLNKAVDGVEQRFEVYVRRCVAENQENHLKRMKRSISKAENLVRANFQEGQKEVFERKVARTYRHREALKSCFGELLKDINLHATTLLDTLYEKVISSSDVESVMRWGDDHTQRNAEFLQLLCGRLTHQEFHDVFLPALQADHPHLCQQLVEAMAGLEDKEDQLCITCRIRSDVQVRRLAAPLLKSEAVPLSLYSDLLRDGLSNRAKWAELLTSVSDHSLIIDSLQQKYPNFYQDCQELRVDSLECSCSYGEAADVDDVSFSLGGSGSQSEELSEHHYSSIQSVHSDSYSKDRYMEINLWANQESGGEKDYKMTPTRRGICIIINNVKFSYSKLAERVGSERDSVSLRTTFKKLGFEVEIENNLTAQDLKRHMQDISKRNHSNYSALVCCLLSHGKDNRIYGTDGTAVYVMDILKDFTAKNCPSLVGKPKLFFIQADRGKETMNEYVIPQAGSPSQPPEGIPGEADFLIGYCTPPGYSSFRSTRTGSWYIQTLCDVLNTYSDRHDLLSCLVMVNEKVAKNSVKREGDDTSVQKQIPAPVFTLRKSVHLTFDPSNS